VTAAQSDSPRDECYRCGYDLRGIANERPCPECGLLAERSRRETDELHNSRPKWLRSIARGIELILIAILIGGIWVPLFQLLMSPWLDRIASGWTGPRVFIAVSGFVAAIFMLGVILLTRREGYAPADAADRRLRWSLRLVATLPLVTIALLAIGLEVLISHLNVFQSQPTPPEFYVAFFLGTFGLSPLPILLFLYLRGLAKRARSAHLAEHCAIVGIGASATIVYVGAWFIIQDRMSDSRLGDYWFERSTIVFILILAVSVAVLLFALWSLYLLIRFAIAFHLAARQLRRKWSRDDLAADPSHTA
jgi:hypothetical protein